MSHSNAERILEASPPPEALSANPYTVDELDNLVNRARVWATIVSLKKPLEEEEDRGPERMLGFKRGFSSAVQTLRERVEAFAKEPNKANEAEVLGALDALEQEIDG